MRALAVIAVGVVAGGFGAVLATRLGSPPAVITPSQAAAPPEAPMVVPPGWDPRYLHARLDAVEAQLAALSARGGEEEAAPPPASPREQERVEHYQRELTAHEERLAEHGREPLDATWAAPMQETITARMRAAVPAAQRVEVECRAQTCAVRATYPTPVVALENQDRYPVIPGCSGVASTPTPPTSAGPYELTGLYYCR